MIFSELPQMSDHLPFVREMLKAKMSTKWSLARFPEMITLCALLTLATDYSLGQLISLTP
ncbi:MAG: hypothetical protein HRT52_22455, partial [Colwellia sp.]|nr:hypothetical protein [Colwellia sp.]